MFNNNPRLVRTKRKSTFNWKTVREVVESRRPPLYVGVPFSRADVYCPYVDVVVVVDDVCWRCVECEETSRRVCIVIRSTYSLPLLFFLTKKNRKKK